MALALTAGLTPPLQTPPLRASDPEVLLTEKAALAVPPGQDWRVTVTVREGDRVPQGGELARLRNRPEVRLVAPMPATVAAIRLNPGSRLSEIVLFHEPGGDRACHRSVFEPALPGATDLRLLMQMAGLWPLLRRRPFGGMPTAAERPNAIFVMATDTRPLAADPLVALRGQMPEFGLGLDALGQLTDGPVYVCQPEGADLVERGRAGGRAVALACGARHPQGLAGVQILHHAPLSEGQAIWDIAAEDVAALGHLLKTGYLPETRLVSVAGPGLRESRLLRTQPGADLRGLVQGIVQPGRHRLLSGSALDGYDAHWLGWRDRQVTVLPRADRAPKPHWFRAALTRSALPSPVIPTPALDQALGGAAPAAALVRALSAGEDEAATRFGALSLQEEDLALADYVLGGTADLRGHLRRFLTRAAQEAA